MLTDSMKLEFSAKEYKNFKEMLAKSVDEIMEQRLFIIEKKLEAPATKEQVAEIPAAETYLPG